MADGKRFLGVGARFLILAAIAGCLAGAAAVYVSARIAGNTADLGGETPAVVQAEAGPEDAACASKSGRAKALGKQAVGEVAAMLAADPPQSLKSLAFNRPDGSKAMLADFAGKTVLVNLWATWCAPCRAEMPALDALQKQLGSERFEVAAVNVDTGDDSKPKRFLAETGVTALKAYRDNTMVLFNDVKARGLALGLPVTLLVDPEGCLLTHMNGPAEWAGEDARKFVEAAVKVEN